MSAVPRRLTEAGPAIVLRAFLGVTFTFAGLQKLANPNFFRASSPTSFQAQTHGAIATSPIAPLLRLTLHQPVFVATVIAIAEVLVGLGTLAGFLARAAAAGGAALSLSFFLSISYGTSPYYYGSDIVFVFAWTVLIIGGAGAWSLDALLARPSAERTDGSAVAPTFLRRQVVAAAGVIGAGALIGTDFGIGRAGHSSSATATTTALSSGGSATTVPSSGGSSTKGTRIVELSKVPAGSAFGFTDAATGNPAFVVHEQSGSVAAFSAICTHAGCTVAYNGPSDQFQCPCHGSVFNASTGAVENGPATSPLPSIPVVVDAGVVYRKA
jgi:thiosulfate dehydrogenase [quinone] large subunit